MAYTHENRARKCDELNRDVRLGKEYRKFARVWNSGVRTGEDNSDQRLARDAASVYGKGYTPKKMMKMADQVRLAGGHLFSNSNKVPENIGDRMAH